MLPPALGSSTNAVASLSRAFAREIENLPTRYLREFYKIKVKDDIKALLGPESPCFKARYKRVSRELRKLEAANNGSSTAYEHILSLAYGRKGKLRRELMEPFLSDPSTPLPPSIIPPVESSRPPVYSPEITALLTSTISRNGSSSRTAKQLQHPPTLPMQADPKSTDAKILGPLSKRREVNLRWRFFEKETAKVRPPIEVSRVHPTPTGKIEGKDTGDVERLAPLPVGFQGTSVLHDLEDIASPKPNLPKRATSPSLPHSTTNNAPSAPTVNHFIRRQHRKILGKIPIMAYFKRPHSPVGKYEVSLSPLAYSDSLARLTSAVPMADEADLAWLRLPPPPQEPRIELDSALSQKSRIDEEPKHRPSWVDDGDSPDEIQHRPKEGMLEPRVGLEPKVEEGPRVGMKSRVDQNPQEESKRPGRSDETTDERSRRG